MIVEIKSADELRYSLRFIVKYLPWHRGNNFFVTDNQIPKWLDISQSRIKVISHKDIIPKYIYPTYDSNTIELYFDKIPGITEQFIYLNDDFFLNKYIYPAFFFTSKDYYPKIYGQPKAKNFNKKEINNILNKYQIYKIYHVSSYYTLSIIKTYFDKNFKYHYLCHAPYVFYCDLYELFRQLFYNELRDVNSEKFRNPFKVQTIYLYQTFLQYATQHEEFPMKLGGKGKVSNFTGYSFPNNNRSIKSYFAVVKNSVNDNKMVHYGDVTDNSSRNNKLFNLLRKSKTILAYNLNDKYSKSDSLNEMTEYLITRYPDPSKFEKKRICRVRKRFFITI